ncbi:nuclear pore complex protein DDB_G0274915-like isoform X2 [Bombus pascuorum]|uniref:nuclear pore complex protein DDB_G0274915-like isoform X2 n=1 Tax=Bombus pascuorum TaxID=65598 RepID=UPI00298E0A36|nr:nuclear pore complex protein DDB_G0274915-like isoform X2 [Bombus pascuorum]
MWELRNRSVIILVSVLSGCVFLYSVWGPIFILTISLFLTIYACYFLIINDSLLSPHAFLLLDYCKHISFEVRTSFGTVIDHVYRMERRRGSNYQLSTDPYPTRKSSSHFVSITQLSPIPKNLQKANVSNDISSKIYFYPNSEHSSYDHDSFVAKRTSTPMLSRNKEELENEMYKLSPAGQVLSKRPSPLYGQNQVLMQVENSTYFDAEGSSWDSKVDTKVGERKDIQTATGPLLASTRYNIDPKVYNDVTSPGLTARLTKYATEASNKLAHQSKYRVGQFPKVNLHASSVPLINVKSMKTRTQATVRVAPSHTIRYSPPSKQNILSNVRHSDNSYSSPSVAQALREISLKRHASREDVAFDPAKKQRRDIVASKEFEVQNETKQKRSRDEFMKSEEDISPQSNKIVRPTKRTKTPSCYDIINSLSSSKHVVSGVKRKARDFSRSGTPDFEKHFKSLECVQSASTETIAQVPSTSPKYPDYELTERRNNSNACNSVDKPQEHSPLKGILKAKGHFNDRSVENEPDHKHGKPLNAQNSDKDFSVESIESIESAKLTHKLFMRAEPARNEKLRMLVEEQGNIRAKFTTDDVEEIKKEDITDMRQTSMKARLQSMFDAISGKAASRINPDVVIQAEEVNAIKSVACTVTCATLNSSTTTTNVNTTPISTSAVAPSLGSSESNTKSPKYVAFNLPAKNTSSNANVQFADTSERKIENVLTSVTDKTIDSTPGVTFSTTKSEIVSQPVVSVSSTTSSTSLNVQNFDSNKSTTIASTTSTSSMSTTFMFDTVSANNKTPLLAVPATTSIFGTVTTAAPIPSGISMSTTTTAVNAKNEPSESNSRTNVSQVATICSSSVNVSIGNTKGGMIFTSPHTNLINSSSVAGKREQNTGFTSIDTKANVMPFTSVANITGSNDALSKKSNANVSTPMFIFGSKTNNPPTTSTKTEGFVFGSAGNASENSEKFGASTSTSRQASMIPNAATSSINGNIGTQANSVTNASSANTGFEANAKVSLPTFGSSTSSTFASHPSSSSSVNDNKAGFSFGKASMTTNTATGTSNVGPFAVANNNLPSSFGATSSTSTASTINSSMAQIAPNTGSIFTNSSSAPSIFGTTTVSNQPVFGTSSNLSASTATFTLPKSTTTSVFGSNVATTSAGFASTNSMPIFSGIPGGSSMGAISTTSIPMFGSSASTSTSGINTSGTSNVGSNLFSSANLTTSISMFSTTSNIFGQANSATGTSFKSSTGVFGNNSGSTLFGSTQTTTSSTFSAANVPSNSTAPTFGSTNIPVSNASVPVFGATTTGTPDFASQNQNKENPGAQTSTSQSFGITSIFRGDNTGGTPVFGAANGAASHFNSPVSNNTFAGQNVPISSNPTFAMGTAPTANGPPAFSDSNKVSPFGAQASSTFGSPNVSSTPTFGNANINKSNTPGLFTFGASQTPPQQNATTFAFGSNSNTSASAPFQFGTATSNSGTGFNFSAPTTTPSINFGTTNSTTTFNASTPGMFSIGSGSTASRSRNSRTRKLR